MQVPDKRTRSEGEGSCSPNVLAPHDLVAVLTAEHFRVCHLSALRRSPQVRLVGCLPAWLSQDTRIDGTAKGKSRKRDAACMLEDLDHTRRPPVSQVPK